MNPIHVSLFTRVGAAGIASSDLFRIEPSEGTGPSTLRIIAERVGGEVDRTVPVVIRADAGDAARMDVRFRAIAAPDQPPFGVIYLPPDPSSLAPS